MAGISDRVIECAPEVFTQNLNKLPHEFNHNLAGNPLFELNRLVEVAGKVAARNNPHVPGGDVYFNDGVIDAGEKPKFPDLPRTAAVDFVKRIETSQAWIILKHVEREEGYREVLENCMRDILQLSGPQLLRKIKWFEAILFITSPNRVTEYHIDREVSWILQIQGDKDIHVFDRADKDIVPDEELEVYWTADNRAAAYKPQYEDRAHVYHMKPGTGVHVPVNSPHWLKNGNNISVTLNVNFQFYDKAWANLYRANYYLRRAGLHPTAPGVSPLADRIKSTTFTAMQRAKQAIKGRPPIPAEAREQNKRIARLALRPQGR